MLLVTVAVLFDENKRDIVSVISQNWRSDNIVTMIVSKYASFIKWSHFQMHILHKVCSMKFTIVQYFGKNYWTVHSFNKLLINAYCGPELYEIL